MKRMLYAVALIVGLPFLGGCGKALRYQAKAMDHLTLASADSSEKKDNVTVLLKRFDSRMNDYYFNKPNLQYVAYQLTINNQSDEEWELQSEELGVPIVELACIQQHITPSYSKSFLICLIPMAGVNLIAGTVYLCLQTKTKDRIIMDLREKVFQGSVSVAAHTKASVIFFVDPESVHLRLNVTLINTQKIKQLQSFVLSMI